MNNLQERYYNYARSHGLNHENLRNPEATRALIAGYFLGLAVALLSQLAMAWSINFVWLFVVAILGAIICWTLLRATIDAKDAAPPHLLDSYEAEVLARWRTHAFTIFTAALMVGGVLLASLSFLLADISGHIVGLLAGLFMVYLYLAVSTLPAIGYALTFNQPTED